MTRLYLNQDGSVRAPAPGEHGHLDMARTTLGPGWHGDVEETYAAMWNAGWVRIVDSPDTLVGEQWRDAKPVAFADLPPVQREWLDAHSVQAGKEFVWNASVLTRMREGQMEAPPVQPRVLAFIAPQTVTGHEPLAQFLTSVREIERQTGLDFFAELPKEVQDQFETSRAEKLW